MTWLNRAEINNCFRPPLCGIEPRRIAASDPHLPRETFQFIQVRVSKNLTTTDVTQPCPILIDPAYFAIKPPKSPAPQQERRQRKLDRRADPELPEDGLRGKDPFDGPPARRFFNAISRESTRHPNAVTRRETPECRRLFASRPVEEGEMRTEELIDSSRCAKLI